MQGTKKQNLSTFSDEGSEHAQDSDIRSQLLKGPFYWNIKSHNPTAEIGADTLLLYYILYYAEVTAHCASTPTRG